jgi:hypothetical protein
MNCVHCSSSCTTRLSRKTSLGYKVFSCRHCNRIFNERTRTQFNLCRLLTSSARTQHCCNEPQSNWLIGTSGPVC